MTQHDVAGVFEAFEATDSGSEFDRAEQQYVTNPLDDPEPRPPESVPAEADPADVHDQAEVVLPDDQPATTWVKSGESENRTRFDEVDLDS